MVLYCSPEWIGYAELEQAWKCMTLCCTSFHPCRSIGKQIWPCHKNGQGQPSDIIWTNLWTHCCIPNFKVICRLVPKRIFEGFYHIWTGKPSRSCDPEHLNKFSSHQIFHGGSIWNLGSNGLVYFEEKKFENVESRVTLDKNQWMTLTLGCQKSSCTHLFD